MPSAAELDLVELTNASGLRAQVLPSGALYALRHDETLLNQFLPGAAEQGLFRLLIRWRSADGGQGWAPLVGPSIPFSRAVGACWCARPLPGLECHTRLSLHPAKAAWAWRVDLYNASDTPLTCEVFHAQDLGLGDEAAVRNNEAYISQYIDLQPVHDAALGQVLLARQNQPMAGGRYPWAAFACVNGATAFCTDGFQFFGADHRLTGEPRAVREPSLPSQRLQYEFALAGLQSPVVDLEPGARSAVTFLGSFHADHPAASDVGDVSALSSLLPADWAASAPVDAAYPVPLESVFVRSDWSHGSDFSAAQLERYFGSARRHQEFATCGSVASFFCAGQTHVVLRAKEAGVARPHGHILRSGEASWIDDAQFGVTCYASGIFGAQAYLGNPSIARLLSVVRNPLNLARSCGQRVLVRGDAGWRQLGVPSAFVMEPGRVRWLYASERRTIEATVWCSAALSASYLTLAVLDGAPAEFLITHQLALGGNELEAGGWVDGHTGVGWVAAWPAEGGFVAQHLPGLAFAVAAAEPDQVAAMGGDELLYVDGRTRSGGYLCIRTVETMGFSVVMAGTHAGRSDLVRLVKEARAELVVRRTESRPPSAPVSLRGSNDPAVARVDEILPWFTHNAAIHFSAPHGLEQYGGAAWGVRDVCQGSVEWLLSAGRFDVVRRVLLTVFGQQYAGDGAEGVAGGWPQWFMFRPFHAIQQAHSHGDVCFWPLKALCDYVEASNDFSLLDAAVGYTDPKTFSSGGPLDAIWTHCDRIVALVEARFLPGTALVNYGDGDWDDTLQPADPTLRTRMVSAWTVALAYQTFQQLAEVARRAGHRAREKRLSDLVERIHADFHRSLMPAGTATGFLVREADGTTRPLLHPHDKITGIRYRLLPMTRAVIAELFSPDEAEHHLQIVERELHYADGVRLMSEPATYAGGVERLFKRAETAANVGREVGLQYVHAHLRYAEAMAKVGDAERLWRALQVVNPVALGEILPNAAARQSNVYFSSSDADFPDRVVAARRWNELRNGSVPVRAGWRLYSSGPGLYLHKVRACLLGVRESFGSVIFDPVLPRELDGVEADVTILGLPVRLHFSVRERTHTPRALHINGTLVGGDCVPNPYRTGGIRIGDARLKALFGARDNRIDIEL